MNVRSHVASPYLSVTLAMAMWGGNAVAARLAVGEVSPMAVTSLRWLIVVAVLAAVAGRSFLSEWPTIRPHWPRVFALGALGYTAFNAFYYVAARSTSAVNLGVIQGIVPALVLCGGILLHRAPVRPLQIAGVLLTLVGAVVAASRGSLDALRAFDFTLGDLWMVAASILYAGYSLGLRNRPPVSPLSLFVAMASAAFAASLPLLGYEVATGSVLWPTPTGCTIIAFVAVFPSFLAQLLYLRGVDLIGPARASVFVNLVPLFAAIFGVLILRESFAIYQAVALASVLGGIWLTQRGATPS